MEQNEIKHAVEAVLFAAGEPVALSRLSAVLNQPEEEILSAMTALMDQFAYERRGIRIVKLENAYQMCSASEYADYVAQALETRKPPKLSQSLLETLTVVGYYQPVTKTYIEQIRGVDSTYSITALLHRKLIEECGRLNVPGRPILYRTTPDFLRVFGLTSLTELPPIDLLSLEVNPEEAEQLIVQQTEEQNAEQTEAETEPTGVAESVSEISL